MVARNATHQFPLLRPHKAILSPGRISAASKSRCILAILRATSLYCKLSPLKSVNAFRSQFFFMLFSISSISLSSISFGRISWYRRQKYKKQGISVSLWDTILNFGRKFFCNFKSLSSPVSFANHPSSFSEYHKLFKTKRLQPEGCFIHLSAIFQSAPMRAEKTFGV